MVTIYAVEFHHIDGHVSIFVEDVVEDVAEDLLHRFSSETENIWRPTRPEAKKAYIEREFYLLAQSRRAMCQHAKNIKNARKL